MGAVMAQISTRENITDTGGARLWVHAGPMAAEVIITPYALADADGRDTLATLDCERRLILISDQLPPAGRCRAVLDQMHALHCAMFGEPTTPEGWRLRRQVVFCQLMRDLARQGGGDTLVGMRPYSQI